MAPQNLAQPGFTIYQSAAIALATAMAGLMLAVWGDGIIEFFRRWKR